MQKLGDILSERALAHFAGRERELSTLLGLFEKGGPLIVHVHGVAGIGKSSLLQAFVARARADGTRVVRMDCRTVEPTARGLLSELSDALGKPLPGVEDDLMEAVWGYRNDTASNVVDVVVRALRRKLGIEASAVETVRGTGYRFRSQGSIR